MAARLGPAVMRRLPRRRRGQPSFPMAIVGHGRIRHLALPERSRRSLHRFIEAAPDEWGLLFVRAGGDRRWMLYSADPRYTAMFAPAAHTLELTFDIFSAKFPCWNFGWQIS